ncbi:ATP-binding protein [Arcobacter aquimarinus]|uniref:histidine kinase n=1 Tax=Arcobacter aquimarinus TaxID=1315211 RepID=A0AAE7E073_9BACT|nr:ATP-binding protein [Arcobacter aquimarinus]QKE25270.1 two-component system sensor histidine kinase [Arcobacter aquimarinus]RXI36682.1 two-component sensor histidine kinase [Arcobacter aquimarinus]
MTNKLSIKKKLLIYSFLIQAIILGIFSFSLYKALEISTLDKLQTTLKVIILDVTDDLLEETQITDALLDEEKEYNFEPLFIRILDNNTLKPIIQTSNFPQNIEHKDENLNRLKEGIVVFEEQSDYLVSRIKINFHNKQKVIIEVLTTKDILSSTLENILYILSFILPIVLIFAVIGGNFLIYKSFLPIENILEELKKINANDLSARLKSTQNKDEINQLIIEVNNLLERLEESFERITQFSSDASHELKTPLTIIRGEIEIALRKDRTIEEYKEALNSSLNEITIIEQTINDLLFLAKNKKDLIYEKEEIFYLDELVDESISELKGFAKLNEVTLELLVNDSAEIKGFPNLLKIAVKNAIKNAIQFSHKNTKVILNIFEKNDEIIVSIQDFGIGIPKDEQSKIFEKFYRTDKSRNKNSGGTGLGMSIMKKIIDINYGRINIESIENIGTTIYLSFYKK